MIEEKRLIPLKFDLMFKKVFGDNNDKKPLRELLKCILDIEPKEITILNPEIIGSSYYDKRTTVDLIVELEDGTKIGIEMKSIRLPSCRFHNLDSRKTPTVFPNTTPYALRPASVPCVK